MTNAGRARGYRNGPDGAAATHEQVDPAHAEQINRDLADAEDEARRLGGGMSREAFERDADALIVELRSRIRALKP
jgi:hypothetical protein